MCVSATISKFKLLGVRLFHAGALRFGDFCGARKVRVGTENRSFDFSALGVAQLVVCVLAFLASKLQEAKSRCCDACMHGT